MFQTLFTDSPDFSYFLFTTIPGQVIQVIPFVLLVGLIDSLIRFLRIKRGNITSYRIGNEVVKTLLVCYFAGLFALVWVPPRFWSYLWHMAILGWYDPGAGSGPLFTWSFHFVPSLYQWIAGDLTLGSWVRTMLGGNVLMFLPFGFLVPFALKRSTLFRIMKLALLTTLVIEIVQPFLGRSFDVDDLICNLLGAFLGYLLFALLRAFFPNLVKLCSRIVE